MLPVYAFWKFDDFSWGDTRKTANEKTQKGGIEYEGEFDSSKITMKRWAEFERDRRNRASYWASKEAIIAGGPQGQWVQAQPYDEPYYNDHM